VNGRPFANFSLRPYISSVALNDAIDYGEAYSFAVELARRMKPMERLEHSVHILLLEPSTVIFNKIDGLAMLFDGPELNACVTGF
jgi:hypothetical protein